MIRYAGSHVPAARDRRRATTALPLAEADQILGGFHATLATRQLIALAFRAGLKPGRSTQVHRGAYRVFVDSGGRTNCLFGGFDVGATTGRVLRGYLMRGNDAEELRYDFAGLRTAFKDWETR